MARRTGGEIRWIALLAVVMRAATGCKEEVSPQPDTIPPAGGITINGGDAHTVAPSVALALAASDDSGEAGITMMLSNAPDFTGASWEAYGAARVWTLSAEDGVKTVYAKFRDAAGNESVVSADSTILDSTVPGVPSGPDLAGADDTGASSTDNITSSTSDLAFSGSGAEVAGGVRLYDVEAGLLGSAAADGMGLWSVEVALSEGTHVLFARALDAARNESLASAPLALTIDTTAPATVPALLEPVQATNTGSSKRPVFAWTGAGEDGIELQADESPTFDEVDYDWICLSGASYIPATDMAASAAVPVGTRYYLRIRAVDSAGNTGAWSDAGPPRYVNVGRSDGDPNGDGFADLIVGAPLHGSSQGRAYVYLGGSSPDGKADLTAEGEEASSSFGASVGSVR